MQMLVFDLDCRGLAAGRFLLDLCSLNCLFAGLHMMAELVAALGVQRSALSLRVPRLLEGSWLPSYL